ncbi:MAG: MotA/TolQ/ExbB proton channel family protein [Methylococcales bacterium]|nr:MotA/TolQ/ExbB proton channel family protein [Methylococcales bacterium]
MTFSESIIEIQGFMDKGGFVMPPLIILTMILWYSLGYRYWILRRRGKDTVRQLLVKIAKQPAHAPRDVLEQAVAVGLAIKSSAPHYLRRRLDAEFWAIDKELGKHSAVIKTIVMIAPLMGLLGTVTGMIETFNSLAEMALFTQSGGIAGGIAQALLTTQMGLSVAIPGVLVKSMLDRKQRKIQAELEQIKDLISIDVR